VGEPLLLKARFQLVNGGEGFKKVAKLTTSCGCTGAQIEPQEISPGATAVVTAQLKLETPGERSSQVWIAFEDGTLQTMRMLGSCYRRTDSFLWPRLLTDDPKQTFFGVLVSPQAVIPEIALAPQGDASGSRAHLHLVIDEMKEIGRVSVEGAEMAIRWYRGHPEISTGPQDRDSLEITVVEGTVPWN